MSVWLTQNRLCQYKWTQHTMSLWLTPTHYVIMTDPKLAVSMTDPNKLCHHDWPPTGYVIMTDPKQAMSLWLTPTVYVTMTDPKQAMLLWLIHNRLCQYKCPPSKLCEYEWPLTFVTGYVSPQQAMSVLLLVSPTGYGCMNDSQQAGSMNDSQSQQSMSKWPWVNPK